VRKTGSGRIGCKGREEDMGKEKKREEERRRKRKRRVSNTESAFAVASESLQDNIMCNEIIVSITYVHAIHRLINVCT